jgi:hypothetical protein
MSTIRRTSRKRPAPARPPRRPRDPAIPPVPTFPTNTATVTPPEPTNEDEALERVRQMVEAAYT